MINEEKKAGIKRGRGGQSRRRSGKRSKVVSLLEWQERARPGAKAGDPERQHAVHGDGPEEQEVTCFSAGEISVLSTPQKQLALIYYIISNRITDREIDALVGVLAASASPKPVQ
jgi:hypothetical protein